jgi:predicted ester cyclase
MSIIDQNKLTARRWLDFINENKIEEICEMTAPMWRMYGGPPNLSPGHEGVRELFRTIGPIEQQFTVDDIIAENDKVVLRTANTCVQESFFGLAGNNRQQKFSAIFILQIADGKVTKTWRNADDLGRVLQLGARIEPAN